MSNVWNEGAARPILPVADLDRAVGFYREIGFEAEAYDGGYAFIRGDGVSIDLSRTDEFDPFVMAGMAYLTVQDPDATHAAIRATGLVAGYHDLDEAALRERWSTGLSLARITPVGDKPWRMREFALADPDNNLLRIGAPLRR